MIKVLVFKTSISKEHEVKQLTPLLNELMDKNEKWNFDLEDRDNILRVEAISIEASDVIQNLQQAGFACEELED